MKLKRIFSLCAAVLLSAYFAAVSAFAVTNEGSREFKTDGVDFHQLAINEVFPNIKPEDIKVVTFSFSADIEGMEEAMGQIAVNSPASGWVEADVDLTLLGGSMTTSLDVKFAPEDEWYHCSVATWGFESGVTVDLLNESGQSLITEVPPAEADEIMPPDETVDEAETESEIETGDTAEDSGYVKGAEDSASPNTGVEFISTLAFSLSALGTAAIASKLKRK